LSADRKFTAIFAQNDKMAVGAVRALRDAGKRVPEDVSVIGYDDVPLASFFSPPLTTLRQPMEEFGKRASDLLIRAIQNPNCQVEQVWLKARLVERASCGPLTGKA
jgi:LacI family transcriptional regulator